MLVWQAARKKAAQVRDSYEMGTPADLKWLCFQLGIRVVEGNLKGSSGLIIKEAGSDPTIYLEESDSELRKRFTLAHELGHYFERVEAEDDQYSFRDKSTFQEARGDTYGLMEFYADEFAGELLMPEDEFTQVWQRGGHVAAAAFFKVSPSAAQKRHQRIEASKSFEKAF